MKIETINENIVEIDGVRYRKISEEPTEKEEPAYKFNAGDVVYSINTTDVSCGDLGKINMYKFNPELMTDRFNYSIGNVFASEEEALAAIARLQAFNKANNKAENIKKNIVKNFDDLRDFVNSRLDDAFNKED